MFYSQRLVYNTLPPTHTRPVQHYQSQSVIPSMNSTTLKQESESKQKHNHQYQLGGNSSNDSHKQYHPYVNPSASEGSNETLIDDQNDYQAGSVTPVSTRLPSFSELLTSIPLPRDFRKPSADYFSHRPNSSTSPSQTHEDFSSRRTRSLPTPTGTSIGTPPYTGPASPLHVVKSPSASAWDSVPGTTHPNTQSGGESNGSVITTPRRAADSASSIVFVNTSSNSSVEKKRSTKISSQSSRTDGRTKHTCKTCFRSFTTSGHLARHNRIHTGERDHLCPWPTCEAKFARHDNCMQHYKTHTNGKSKRIRSTSKVTKR